MQDDGSVAFNKVPSAGPRKKFPIARVYEKIERTYSGMFGSRFSDWKILIHVLTKTTPRTQ